MTIVSELVPAFKDMLVRFAGHHWTAKGIISLLFFALSYGVFSKKAESENLVKQAWLVVGSVILGVLIIAIFNGMVFSGVL